MEHLQRLLVFVALVWCAACGNHNHIPDGAKANRILVYKSAHTMMLLNGTVVLKTYKIAIGRSPVGPKTQLGDHKTPEGNYTIDAKKSASRFYRALHISYPNLADRQHAERNGVDPGGDVEIHGIQNGLSWMGSLHRTIDWTDGCVAVTDDEIDEIWRVVDVGTPIEIRP